MTSSPCSLSLKGKFFLVFGLILLNVLTLHRAHAQQYNLVSKTSIPSPELTTIDLLGQLYIKSKNGILLKYDDQGQKLYEYEDAKTQFISLIDASSPLRLFTFYQPRQSYQYYDRVLTPSTLLSLENHQNEQYTACAASSDNNIWLWEPSLLKLQKFNPALGSTNLDIAVRYYIDQEGEITQIKEYRNRVYLNNQNKEILVFDILGNYMKKIPVMTDAIIRFYGNELYWLNGRLIEKYNINTMQQVKMSLPEDLPQGSRIHSVYLQETTLIVVLEKQMLFYRIVG